MQRRITFRVSRIAPCIFRVMGSNCVCGGACGYFGSDFHHVVNTRTRIVCGEMDIEIDDFRWLNAVNHVDAVNSRERSGMFGQMPEELRNGEEYRCIVFFNRLVFFDTKYALRTLVSRSDRSGEKSLLRILALRQSWFGHGISI